MYRVGSAGPGAGSPAPAGPKIFKSARLYVSLVLFSKTVYSRHLQRANPFVSPQNLQSTLLPVCLVLDIRLQNHLALSGNVIYDDIEDWKEVSVVFLAECKHLGPKGLEILKTGIEGDFKDERFGDGT